MNITSKEAAGEFEFEIDSDYDLKFLSLDEDILNLLGFDDEELKSPGRWRTLIGQEDEAAIGAIIRQLGTGTGWVGRLRAQTKTGERVIFEVDAEAEKTSTGTVLVRGYTKDVTGRAGLEAALRKEEAKLRLLSERIPVVLWSTDKDLCFNWSSGPGLKTLGLQEDEIVGRTLQEYFDTEDTEFAPISAHLRALEGETTSYDVEWWDRNWRCCVEPSRDEVGDVNGIIGIGIDVTDQSALQEEALKLGRGVAQLTIAADASLTSTSGADEAIDIGGLRIDVAAHSVTKHERSIGLTPTEFKLLVALARNPGRVLERSFLLETVWGYDFAGASSPLSMTVRRLREKVEDDPQNPTFIETIRGLGYRLTP